MAHEKRASTVIELQRALDRPAQPIWDQRNDPWDTRRRALLAYAPEASFHLILQDDAVVCRDLVGGLEIALEALQARNGTIPPVSLYLGRVRPYGPQIERLVTSLNPQCRWVSLPEMLWGVGMVLPVELIAETVAWGDKHPEIRAEDKRIGKFLASKGLATWHTWPSLVDHRPGRSIIYRRPADQRRAHRFIGEDASARGIDWSGRVHIVSSLKFATPKRAPTPTPRRPERRKVMAETPAWPSGQVMRARRTARIDDNGKVRRITKGVTTADSDAAVVKAKPHLWEPLKIDFPAADDSEDSGPLVPVPVGEFKQMQPAPPGPEEWKAYRQSDEVRAWAKAQGLSVGDSGFIAKRTIEAYLAARANANA